MLRLTDVVKNLIIINVLVYFGTVMIPPDILKMGHLYFFQSPNFQPFQLITSMFMHANIQHLLFNMLGLAFLGPAVESILGPKKFLTLYLLCGLGATLLHIGVDYFEYYQLLGTATPDQLNIILTEGQQQIEKGYNYTDPGLAALNSQYYYLMKVGALGASGCVYGVVIAFITMFPNQKMIIFPIPIPIRALYLGIALVGFGLIQGIGSLSPGIAHFAHVGGAITGFLLIRYWKKANLR